MKKNFFKKDRKYRNPATISYEIGYAPLFKSAPVKITIIKKKAKQRRKQITPHFKYKIVISYQKMLTLEGVWLQQALTGAF